MGEFKSFFKDKGLNQEIATGEVEVKPFVKTTRHGKHIRDAGRVEYQRAWIMAKRRRQSGKG